ncbi:MAG TPA: STN domain-containing protein [Candidatus Bathyarchaeia archaeon]|nr:STN domain-containing protein [Candidatus Bathyarchaeia archaeon]
MKYVATLVLLALLAGAPVWADSIVHNGKTYDNVYVREGNSSYYVQDPATGAVTAMPKSEVGAAGVNISSDASARQALLDQWKSAKTDKPLPALTAVAQSAVMAAASARPVGPVPSDPAPAVRAPANSGNASIKLKNVPLRDALRVTLRGQNLDYRVYDNYIYVSTPQRLRQEPLEGVRSRAYAVAGATASDTLPKIVLRNPGGAYPQMGYGGGMGGGGYGGGMGGGYGMGGGGMGMGGGMGGGYGGGMGMRGGMGMGGMGGGMGMRGGMMGGGYGGGQAFSNISDLFFNIDDRLVGETPAVIGVGGLSVVERPTQR